MSDEAQGSLQAGTIVAGRFKIDRLIGQGGMGEVYAAKNVGTGRDVALKMIRGAAGDDETRRFLREAKAATAIQHPNVIEVLDVFPDQNGTPVMVMELLRGETLSALRKRRGAMPLHEVASLLLPVAAALRMAHQKGIVHRDLKPDNIFLSRSSTGELVPKVLDFGIAKVLDPASISSETQGASTSTGSILGTPHYMSFEQAMSEKDIDHRADIWAMGVILFEALTGRRPLEFENLGQMYTAFLQGEVPRIRALVPELPEDAAAVVDRCLQKQRETRLNDLGPLIEGLSRYVDPAVAGALSGGKLIDVLPAAGAGATLSGAVTAQTAAAAPAVSPPPVRRSRGLVIAGVAVVMVAVGLGATALSGKGAKGSGEPEVGAASASAEGRGPAASASSGLAVAAPALVTAPAPSESDGPRGSNVPTAAPSGSGKSRPPGHGSAPASAPAPATGAPATTTAPPTKGIATTVPY